MSTRRSPLIPLVLGCCISTVAACASGTATSRSAVTTAGGAVATTTQVKPFFVRDGFVAGGTQRNHAFVSEFVDWGDATDDEQLLLADAQTSGGLLFAVDPDAADALVAGLGAEGTLAAARIGQLTADPPGTIIVA